MTAQNSVAAVGTFRVPGEKWHRLDVAIAASFALMAILTTMEDHSRVGRIASTGTALVLIAWSLAKRRLNAGHMIRFLGPVTAVLAATVLSALTSIDREFSIGNLFTQHLWFALLFLGVGAWATTGGRQEAFLRGLVLAGALSAVAGVFLYYFAEDLAARGWIGKWKDFVYTATDNQGIPYRRAEGLLQSYTRSAMVFFMTLPATMAVLVLAIRRRNGLLVALCVAAMVFSGWYLLLTKARGAWIATAAACGLTLLLLHCPWKPLLLLAGAFVAAIAAMPAERNRALTLLRDLDNPDVLLSGRIDLWKQGRDPITDNLWTGIGYGGNIFLTDAAQERGYALTNHVRQPDLHNLYMQTLAEVGIIGIVMYAWLVGMLLRVGFLSFLRSRNEPGLHGVAVGMGALFAVFFSGIVYYMNEAHVAQLLWSTAGLVAAGGILLDRPDSSPKSPAPPET